MKSLPQSDAASGGVLLRLLAQARLLGERSQVKRFRGTKPEHVLGVILFGIPGLGVCKDGEATAVLDQPWDDVAEQPGVKRKLAAAARVRADRIVMHASDG
jgi:hypothetical protein